MTAARPGRRRDQRGQASMVAPVDKTSLVMVLVLAAIFLGEPLTWQKAIGAGLIVAGTIVIALAR